MSYKSYKFVLPYLLTAMSMVLPSTDVRGDTTNRDADDIDVKTHASVPDTFKTASNAVKTLDIGGTIYADDAEIMNTMDSIVASMQTPSIAGIEQQGKNVVYVYSDGSRTVRSGGTRAWRNNNPGNLRYYDFARANGAVGVAGNFAVFPDEETGMAALQALLKTDSYRNLTISRALKRYDPNNWRVYTKKLTRLTGLGANTKLCNLNPAQLNNVAQTIRTLEGWVAGNENQISATQYAYAQNAQRAR